MRVENGWLFEDPAAPEPKWVGTAEISDPYVTTRATHLLSGVELTWRVLRDGWEVAPPPDGRVWMEHPVGKSHPISGPVDHAGALAVMAECGVPTAVESG